MKLRILPLLLLAVAFCGCVHWMKRDRADYLLRVCDSLSGACGYADLKGNRVIPAGKYIVCYTDTFRNYAVVLEKDSGFIAIDREETRLYSVYLFDNGPDEPASGLFRIISNHKIGYADSATGQVVIKPQFDCAQPFENGIAQVSNQCKMVTIDDEHRGWESDHWYYIDKKGKPVKKPATITE